MKRFPSNFLILYVYMWLCITFHMHIVMCVQYKYECKHLMHIYEWENVAGVTEVKKKIMPAFLILYLTIT